MPLVTADLVFTGDRWERPYSFVVQGGRIAAAGGEDELAAAYPDEPRERWAGRAD